MEVILCVQKGPEQGKEFRFQEADNFLIGRKDPSSKAHLNVSPEDRYVSRHHFTIEVRPPNVMIRDSGSTNGTFVRNQVGGNWERIDEVIVENGDQIKIGHTILSVTVNHPELEPLITLVDSQRAEIVEGEDIEDPMKDQSEPIVLKEPPDEVEEIDHPPVKSALRKKVSVQPEAQCIRCLSPLDHAIELTNSMLPENFMCVNCRDQLVAEREEAAKTAIEYECFSCQVDVSQLANRDGRAAELADVAYYLCPECSSKGTKGKPRKIGNYQILSELGRGGMGVVFKAVHKDSGRLVALKQLLPIAKADEKLVKRFMREAMIMENFRHYALVWIFETGLEGNKPYIISEFVPNGDFNQFMTPDDNPLLPPEEIAGLISEALVGLSALHEEGFVHRDIKPENLLIRQENGKRQPKLADFGLARSYEKHGGTITRKGEYAGTIFYMPQEQITNFKRVHPPTDIYSMGVTLYYLLSGRFPLDFPSPSQIKRGVVRLKKDPIAMILQDEPVPLSDRRGDLPRSLSLMVDCAVRKEADERYQTAEEFRRELQGYLDKDNRRWMD